MSMILAIFALTLPIALVVLLISAIVKSVRKDGSEDKESFQTVIRTMYIYLVMIVFLLIIVASTISLFNSCMEILLPETSQSYYDSAIINRNRNIAEVTTNMAALCIGIPMFVYYSILAKKEHQSK